MKKIQPSAPRLFALAAILALVAMPVLAAPHQVVKARDLDPVLAKAAATQKVPVVVQLRAGATPPADIMAVSGSKHASRVGAISTRLTPAAIRALMARPEILSVSPDRAVRANLDVAVPATNADVAYQRTGLTGRGAVVAIVDSGVTPNVAVPEWQVLARADLVDANGRAADGFGHGTHIAGIIHAMAPDAQFVVVRALGNHGEGSLSAVVNAIDWVIRNRELYGIDIVNLSLGYAPQMSFRHDPVNIAVRRAWAAGLTVVTTAGNRGRDGMMTINAPGNDPLVLTVGAINDFNTMERGDDGVTTYSGRGPSYGDLVVKPDLVAPGNRIKSALAPGCSVAKEYPEKVVDGRLELSGTSMAAGFVSGAAALLVQQHPGITNDTIKTVFMKSARKLDGVDVFARGAGSLDVMAALEMTEKFPAAKHFNSSSPLVARSRSGVHMYLLTPPAGRSVALTGWEATYGNDSVFGESTFWANKRV